jgi:hypothetical protein
MSRPHEDHERHTLVDHRPGGDPVTFAHGSWLVLGVAHVKAERSDACVSAYETLLEKAATSKTHARPAAIFLSHNERRVVTLAGVAGHDGFKAIAAAWDDHHREAQHRAIAESVTLGLFSVSAAIGAAAIDPASHDAMHYEQFLHPIPGAAGLFSAATAPDTFRGALILNGDDGRTTAIVSRFTHAEAYAEFRADGRATTELGASGKGETVSFPVHVVRTIA